MKIVKKSNYRVIVEPKGFYSYFWRSKPDEQLQNENKDVCEQISDQIKRHVDNVGRVSIEFDSDEVCSHCNLTWETDEKTGEPLCCRKAIDEFNEAKK